jgi:general secretion pathway protein D
MPGQQAAPAGAALVAVSISSPDFRVGGGPYTVPIMISDATGVTAMTVTVRYNPAVVRVRGVQDGSFMRQGNLASGFSQQVDAASGRVDITFNRAGDATGASGGGLLAALVIDPIAAGSTTLAASGVASGATGAAIPLQFAAATISVR